MEKFFNKEDLFRMGKMLMILVVFLSLYFMMKFINEVKVFQTVGVAPSAMTTIDVSGAGDASAVPDMATINFTVEAQGKTVAIAQNLVSVHVNQAMDFLKNAGIDTKDIQTTNYNAYPEYSTPCGSNTICPQNSSQVSKIISYRASENVSVKIRDINNSGKIVDGLGAVGITGISGPDFSIDNPDAVQAQAKQKAIDDAKQKATVLAKQLGVHLGKIVRFSGDASGGVMPMAYDMKSSVAGVAMSPVSNLPSGQNKYSANVVITYEIY
ncbi:MAG: SIMPL domain-containing protein [bacterium]